MHVKGILKRERMTKLATQINRPRQEYAIISYSSMDAADAGGRWARADFWTGRNRKTGKKRQREREREREGQTEQQRATTTT